MIKKLVTLLFTMLAVQGIAQLTKVLDCKTDVEMDSTLKAIGYDQSFVRHARMMDGSDEQNWGRYSSSQKDKPEVWTGTTNYRLLWLSVSFKRGEQKRFEALLDEFKTVGYVHLTTEKDDDTIVTYNSTKYKAVIRVTYCTMQREGKKYQLIVDWDF